MASIFDYSDEFTYLEIKMDEQMARLEASIKHNSVHMDPFTLNRIIAIWKMLKDAPGAFDPSPSLAEQTAAAKAKAQEAI